MPLNGDAPGPKVLDLPRDLLLSCPGRAGIGGLWERKSLKGLTPRCDTDRCSAGTNGFGVKELFAACDPPKCSGVPILAGILGFSARLTGGGARLTAGFDGGGGGGSRLNSPDLLGGGGSGGTLYGVGASSGDLCSSICGVTGLLGILNVRAGAAATAALSPPKKPDGLFTLWISGLEGEDGGSIVTEGDDTP